jgi:UDPglucose 6-dehydrogenase
VLGLAFKPKTDDMREAPSLALITALQDLGAQVRAYDPASMKQARELLSNVVYCESAYECAENAHALVIVTEWEEFRALDLVRLRDVMASPVVVDLRNIYQPEDLTRHGFAYACVGRSSAKRGVGTDSPIDQILWVGRARAAALRS